MKIIFLFIGLLFVSCSGSNAPDNPQARGLFFAKELYNDLLTGKIDEYINLLDEKTRKPGETTDSLKNEFKRSYAFQASEGNSYELKNVEEIKYSNCKSDIEGLYRITTIMTTRDNKSFDLHILLFGYSSDEGKNWKFFQTDSTYSQIKHLHENSCVLNN